MITEIAAGPFCVAEVGPFWRAPKYNDEHRHSGLAFFTPSAVHHGRVEQLAAVRNDALALAYTLHPERFVHGPPVTHLPPDAVYINPPEDITKTTTEVH